MKNQLIVLSLLTVTLVACGSEPEPEHKAESQDERWFRYQKEYLDQTREVTRFANERQAEHVQRLKDAGIDPGAPIPR